MVDKIWFTERGIQARHQAIVLRRTLTNLAVLQDLVADPEAITYL